MKTELILKSDVLDILFENRNKAYGAYTLRKFYDNRLMKSIGGMIAIVITLSAFTLIPKKKITMDKIIAGNTFVIADVKSKIKEIEKPKDVPVPLQKAPSQAYNIPTIVTKVETVKPLENITDSTAISNITEAGDPGATLPGVVQPIPGGGGTGDAPEVAKPSVDNTKVLDFAEVMPSYPGGMDALKRFLQRNLTNPRDLEENEIVSVKMKFVVGYDGKLKGFETIQDGGEEFNKEVLRVLKKMPAWVPGKSNGQNVSVYYTIPVKFVTGD